MHRRWDYLIMIFLTCCSERIYPKQGAALKTWSIVLLSFFRYLCMYEMALEDFQLFVARAGGLDA